MKVGDVVPVTIAGQPIAQATIKEIDTTVEPWTVRMVVPGTVVVMSMRAQLAPEITTDDPAGNVLLTDGVVKPEETGTIVDETVTPVATGTPVENPIGEGLSGEPVVPAISPEVEAVVEEKATEV